jgi:hypothetical protein
MPREVAVFRGEAAYRTLGVDDWADCNSPTIRAKDAIAGREPSDSTRAGD